ncbi:MAG TPA: SH3 domain-containing protein [Chloroflexi bacterium]|nr:SH3 domain-containing protein [Chloroflexota bacterium]
MQPLRLLSKPLAGIATISLLLVAVMALISIDVASATRIDGPLQPGATADANATATVSALLQLQLQIDATRTAVAQLSTTPMPTVLPTNTRVPATPTPRRVPPIAEVLVEGLNIRSGPGTGYPVVANGAIGQRFPVIGQSGNCAWLQVMLEDGTEGWLSGAAAYSSLNVACSGVPGGNVAAAPTPTSARRIPTATPRPAQSAAQPAPPAAPASAASAAGGVITSFEPLGSWRRGDEPYGTLTQSTAQVLDGAASAALAYNFPASAGSSNYVVFLSQPELRIPNGAQALTLQVYGDGSGHILNAWVRDAANQVWQLTFGRINHTGWAPMTATLVASRDWPNGPISGATADQLTPPLSLRALVLDGAPDGVASEGVIYLDALATGSAAVTTSSTASASTTTASTTANTSPVVQAAPAPSGPLIGKIAFTRFNGRTMNTLIYDLASNSILHEFSNWRQPDLAAGYLLVNGEGGGAETIIRTGSNGDNQHLVTTNTEDAFPQFSPSLESLVYASTKVGDGKSRIYYQVDASVQDNARPLSSGDKELVGDYPVYLDNWRIAYQGCNSWAGGSKCGIYAADTRGTTPLRVTDNTSDIPSGNLGSQVLFSSNRAGNWDVWIVNFDGSSLRQLTTDPAIDGLADASPDGTAIAFVSNRSGAWAVWVMNTDGSNQRRLFDINGSYGSGDYDWIRERISWDQ